jgi:ATP-dependent DNA helicase DinG
VRAAFEVGGPLAKAGQSFQRRDGQVEMAVAVAQALHQSTSLVTEAGTGVGKTVAYLVPLLLSGHRAVLSTATHLLQAQLAQRDVPAISLAMGLPVRVAVLKGRSNYVCLHRLDQACQGVGGAQLQDPYLAAKLESLRQWAHRSREGDFSEVSDGDPSLTWRVLASSTRENCLGSACPRKADCHHDRARREAASADWVILNYHLFLAEMQGDQGQEPAWLSNRQTVVFDEAHRLPDIGRQLLGRSLGSQRLQAFARDLTLQGALWAKGLHPWAYLALTLEQAVRQMDRLAPADQSAGRRGRWQGGCPQGVERPVWRAAVLAVDTALVAAFDALRTTAAAAADMQHLLERAHALVDDWRQLVREPERDDEARWMEWSSGAPEGLGWRLVQAPVDTSRIRDWMEAPDHPPRSWIFTSATLGSDPALSWFTQELGLQAVPRLRTLSVPSPFDHLAQMALYVPMQLPEPSDPAHSIELADHIADWASRLGGRTLVLTTTVRAAQRMAHRLRWRVSHGMCAELEVLEESTQTREGLLARFRRAGTRSSQGGARHAVIDPGLPAVLVASMAFWEGVDLAGDVLQLLVIDKLPFPPPDDPIMVMRARRLTSQGLDAFTLGFLPEAELALKQGVGRLIRSSSDQGVVVLGDRRLMTRDYGMRLLGSLPAHRHLVSEMEMQAELDRLRLTRASTRDRLLSGSPG